MRKVRRRSGGRIPLFEAVDSTVAGDRLEIETKVANSVIRVPGVLVNDMADSAGCYLRAAREIHPFAGPVGLTGGSAVEWCWADVRFVNGHC